MKVLDVVFLSELEVRAVAKGRWLLLSDFSAGITTDDGYEILTVGKGFVTDLASVPRLPLMFLLFGGRGREASVLHDYLYSKHQGEREVADAVFFAAMAHEEPWWVRAAMWAGVRVGGWAIWNRRPVPTLPDSA